FLDRFFCYGKSDVQDSVLIRRGGERGEFQGGKCLPGVAVRHFSNMAQRLAAGLNFHVTQPVSSVQQRCIKNFKKRLLAERFKLKNLASRNKRGIDIEERVFDCCCNQRNNAFFNIRQQHILLQFVKPVNFIEEEHGAHAV